MEKTVEVSGSDVHAAFFFLCSCFQLTTDAHTHTHTESVILVRSFSTPQHTNTISFGLPTDIHALRQVKCDGAKHSQGL